MISTSNTPQQDHAPGSARYAPGPGSRPFWSGRRALSPGNPSPADRSASARSPPFSPPDGKSTNSGVQIGQRNIILPSDWVSSAMARCGLPSDASDRSFDISVLPVRQPDKTRCIRSVDQRHRRQRPLVIPELQVKPCPHRIRPIQEKPIFLVDKPVQIFFCVLRSLPAGSVSAVSLTAAQNPAPAPAKRTGSSCAAAGPMHRR